MIPMVSRPPVQDLRSRSHSRQVCHEEWEAGPFIPWRLWSGEPVCSKQIGDKRFSFGWTRECICTELGSHLSCHRHLL